MHNDIPLARGLGLVRGGDGRRDPRRQRPRRRGAVDARDAGPRLRDRGPSRQRRGRAARRVRRVGPRRSAGSRRSGSTRRATCAPSCSSRSCACRPTRCGPRCRPPCRSTTRWPTSGRSRSASPGWPPVATTCSRQLTVDRLHEPYRAAVYPQLPRMIEAARSAGALGACLSGAGSTILAFADSMAGITRIEAAFFAAAADLDLAGRVAGRRAAQRGGAHRRPRLSAGAGAAPSTMRSAPG